MKTINDVSEGERLPELVYDVTATTVVLGALATRDWRPVHHDYHSAVEHNGARHVFLNAPTQLAWFERFLTDWTGPTGRLGRMKYTLRDPVCAGDRMRLAGIVEDVFVDETDCGWVTVAIELRVGPRTCSRCTARIALPTSSGDNPWHRRGADWRP
jgi:hypothetical protein